MISRFSIPPFSVVLLFMAAGLCGYGLIPKLSFQWKPSGGQAALSVYYTFPGASPAAVEQEITAPLEGAFSLVPGNKRMYSVSEGGSGHIELELKKGYSLDFFRFEVASRIRQVYPQLPQGAGFPQIEVSRPGEAERLRPLMIWSLSGPGQATELYQYSLDKLVPALGLLPGVQEVQVSGGNRLEWRVGIDLQKLAASGLTKSDILAALRKHFKRESLGVWEENGQSLSIVLQNYSESSGRDWEHIPVTNLHGRTISLGALASVHLDEQAPRQHYRLNGQNSIRLLIYTAGGANTLVVAEAVQAQLKKWRRICPPGMRCNWTTM